MSKPSLTLLRVEIENTLLLTTYYIGSYQNEVAFLEKCYGWISTGYVTGGEKERHSFWGFVWAGKWSFGFGKIVIHKDPES